MKHPNKHIIGYSMIFGILLSAVDLFSGEIIEDTLLSRRAYWICWESKESAIDLSFSLGSSGCTVNVAKPGEHEYDAGIEQNVLIKKNKAYSITIVAAADSSDKITIGFKQNVAPWIRYAVRSAQLKPTLDTIKYNWINGGPEAIEPNDINFGLSLGKLKGKLKVTKISIIEHDISENSIDDFTCPVKPQKNPVIGNISSLPNGFVVFCHTGKNSIFISELNKWNPVALPEIKTGGYSISISDDGRWILYSTGYSAYIARIDGKYKTKVPATESLNTAGFLRSGPYNTEIFYDSPYSETIMSIQVSLGDTSVSFGSQRILAKLGSDYEFDDYYRINISKDQIWTGINRLLNDTIHKKRSGFLTIPDSGRGMATSAEVYKFKDDDFEQVYGCNHTMSHDGKYCVAVAGGASETGDFSHCSPTSHKGFYVTRFYHSTDTPVDLREHALRYSYSLNWCPPEYRLGEWNEIDFGNYYFTNNNKYLVAGQTGTLSPRKGLWAIHWEDNTWYPLSPDKDTLDISSVAAFIGDYDTKLLSSIFTNIDTSEDTSSNNPIGYKIYKPHGGELYYPGDQCTIQVASKEDGNAVVKLQFGKRSFNLIQHGINPKIDSLIIVTIPHYFLSSKLSNGEIKTDTIYPFSSECQIVLQHYTTGVSDPIYSNGYFTIASNTGVIPHKQFNKSRQFTKTSKTTMNNLVTISQSHLITRFSIFDLMGRSIMEWNVLSGKSFPQSTLRQFCKNGIYIVKFSFIQEEDHLF